jgi:hypothetical protein
MLLQLETKTNPKEGSYLSVWRIGGAHKNLRRPFDPYYYSPYAISRAKIEPIEKVLLSTLESEKVFKTMFPSVKELSHSRLPGIMEGDVPYDQRVAIDMDLSTQSALPSHDAFDLEFWGEHITAAGYYGKDFAECKTHYEMDEIIKWFAAP